MSKRVLILIAAGILAIIAGIFLMKYELTRPEEEEAPEVDPVPDPDPEEEREPAPEIINGPKKGYYYDRHSKTWLKCKQNEEQVPEPVKQETTGQPAQYLAPAPLVVTPG